MDALLIDLGRMEYRQCAAQQARLLDLVAAGVLPDLLLFVEHDPVLTLGASFKPEHLLLPREEYIEREIDVVETDRGGDVTYHGPDQLVAYPIFDVGKHGRDLHLWLRALEEAIIVALSGFGLDGYRFPPNTGVWVDRAQPRKVAAIGIKVRRWISIHGIALNCSNDLSPFDLIVPCGIEGYGVTSISSELGRTVPVEEAKPQVRQAFEQVFGLKFEQKTLDELEGYAG